MKIRPLTEVDKDISASTIGPTCDRYCPAFMGSTCGIPIKDGEETFYIRVRKGEKCHILPFAKELGITVE